MKLVLIRNNSSYSLIYLWNKNIWLVNIVIGKFHLISITFNSSKDLFPERNATEQVIPENSNRWSGEHGIFYGYWAKSMWKFQESIKKEKEFPRGIKKKSCGISMVLGFWCWNFQGVPHQFAEFPRVMKFCFLQNFQG